MVKGLDIFYEYFSEYSDQYVLIGGSACDLSFSDHDENFRATEAAGANLQQDFIRFNVTQGDIPNLELEFSFNV